MSQREGGRSASRRVRFALVPAIGLSVALAGSGPADVRVEGVLPLTDVPPPFPVVETYLAANPADPDNLLASAMSVSAEQTLLYASWDGGGTWEVVAGPDDPAFPGGDPMVAFGGDGRAYLATILPEMAVWRSGDGGRSWKGPAVVAEGLSADREWVAVGPSAGDGPRPVYAAAKVSGERPGTSDRLLFSVSRDGGATFAPPTLTPPDSGYLHTVTDLAVLDDGAVLLPFLVNYASVPGPEEVFRGRRWTRLSTDGGHEWEGPYPVAENLQYGNRTLERAMTGLGGGDVAVDRSRGPHRGTVYLTWPDIVDGHLQIVLARSPDGGRTWSAPVRVNRGGRAADLGTPSVAVNREGVVAVTWNDRRDDPDGRCFRHRVAVSSDGGRTFGPGRAVSDRPTCPGPGARWLNGGDTQGLVALPDGSFRTVWVVGQDRELRPWTAVVRVR